VTVTGPGTVAGDQDEDVDGHVDEDVDGRRRTWT
jgi:hypothetical protein